MMAPSAVRRWLPALLALFVFFTQTASAVSVREMGERFSESLLWRIEAPNGRVSHLFGTVHLSDPEILAIPQPVESAFQNASTVVLELDFSAGTMLDALAGMMLPLSQSLPKLVGERLAGRVHEAMRAYGLPPVIVDRLQPWAIVMLLSMPPDAMNGGVFLDQMFAERALADPAQELFGLETAKEQIDAASALGPDDQIKLLEQTLDQQQLTAEVLDDMKAAWLQRDLRALVQLTQASLKLGDEELGERFMADLLFKRNERMATRLQPLLNQGDVFAAVGALHLPGEGGVLALLDELGYRCTPVRLSAYTQGE